MMGDKRLNKLETTDHFIAYFDILGYEQKISKDDEEVARLLSLINESVEAAMTMAYTFNEVGADIKVRVFSDNFFFCTKKTPYILIILIAMLQSTLAVHNIFIRGSLCYGSIYFDDNYIFGKGLVEAYYLESKIALFPRIILDDSYMKGVEKLKQPTELADDFIQVDFDNNKYINYLQSMVELKEHNEKEEKTPEMKFEDIINKHREIIQENLKTENKKILQKYQWCKNYHNEFCRKHGRQDCLINLVDEI